MTNPNLPATSKQLWALFCATKKDYRNSGLTMGQASELLQAANTNRGVNVAPKAKAAKVVAPKVNEFEALHNKAHAAGLAAVGAAKVVPMVVGEETQLFSNVIDYSKPTYYVADGVCGFAWVNIKPANSGFAKWLMSKGLARKDSYEGGVTYWISDFNQSMQKKEAYAYAYARVLSESGIRAYANSRMD